MKIRNIYGHLLFGYSISMTVVVFQPNQTGGVIGAFLATIFGIALELMQKKGIIEGTGNAKGMYATIIGGVVPLSAIMILTIAGILDA